MTKAIYIAGPMRGIPLWNFPEFDRAAASLRLRGWTVFNPAEHDRDEGLDTNDYPKTPAWFTLEKALQWDFARIIEAGNICLLDGWEESSGAAKELRVAEDVGAKVWRLEGETLTEWDYETVHSFLSRKEERVVAAKTTGEHRVVDSKTGGEKGSKLARFDLVPADVSYEWAEHYGRGSLKYADRNWEKAYPWSLSIAALKRHLFLWEQGWTTDHDAQVGDFPHIVAVAWHALALLTFTLRDIGTDDRHKLDQKGTDDRA